MLCSKSPHLQELTVDTTSLPPNYVDASALVSCRWSMLKCLTLGGQLDFIGVQPPSADSALMVFLAAHPTLESLVLHGIRGRSSLPPLNLPPSALPHLSTVSGTIQDVKGLPNPTILRSLQLTSDAHGAIRTPFICKLLPGLSLLTSLNVWLDFSQPPGDHRKMFCYLLTSCPQLSQLEISCSSYPTFSIVSIIYASQSVSCFYSCYFSAERDFCRTLSHATIEVIHSYEDL